MRRREKGDRLPRYVDQWERPVRRRCVAAKGYGGGGGARHKNSTTFIAAAVVVASRYNNIVIGTQSASDDVRARIKSRSLHLVSDRPAITRRCSPEVFLNKFFFFYIYSVQFFFLRTIRV